LDLESVGTLLLLAGILVLLSIFASKVSERFGVPALLIFIGLGMLAGSEGPGGIYFDDAAVARLVGIVALVLILYSGGLDTVWTDIRPVLARGIALSTVGVLVTAFALGAFVAWIAGLSLGQGLLLGAVASSTDAAAVFAVLRSRGTQLKGEVRSLLELESGANDPTAVFLTISIIALISGTNGGLSGTIVMFFWQMGVGAAVGFALSKLAVFVINRIQLDHDGLYPVLSLALVVLTYGCADLARGSGFLAVYVAGLVMGNSIYVHKRSLIRFHDGLAWLGQIGMFLTLGLLVFPSRIGPVIVTGLLAAVFLIFVARPLSVVISLTFSRFRLREQVFISWVGLRGAAPIVLATFALVAGVDGADEIFNIVFFVVLVSVLVQGTTVAAAARWLKVEGTAFRPNPFESDELPNTRLVEYHVPAHSDLVGRQVAKAGLPDTARLLLIFRYGSFVLPSGGMRLRRDDVLTILADEAAIATLGRFKGLDRRGGTPLICKQGGLELTPAGEDHQVASPAEPASLCDSDAEDLREG